MIDESDLIRAEHFLEYHRGFGLFTWSVSPGRKTPVGELAGYSRADTFQFPVIVLHGRRIPADRLAWYMVYDEFVDRPLIPKNGDYDDVRIENLQERT
jgi:hypothetical protein